MFSSLFDSYLSNPLPYSCWLCHHYQRSLFFFFLFPSPRTISDILVFQLPMSWWRWTCSERGACSFNLPWPSSLWAEETLFLSVFTFFWGLFSSPTLYIVTIVTVSAAQPFLLQQVNNQLVHDFLSQQNNRLFLFLSELMDLFVAGRDQSAADQPNNLAEGHPPL